MEEKEGGRHHNCAGISHITIIQILTTAYPNGLCLTMITGVTAVYVYIHKTAEW